jgi:TPR repeat protein
MKDIEALMEKAKNGDQRAFDYLLENSLDVFSSDFDDPEELYNFLEACKDAGIDVGDISDYFNLEKLRDLAREGEQWAFDYLHAEHYDYIADDIYEYLDFLIECENEGVDIDEYDDFIFEGVEYGNENLINHLAELGEFGYLDVNNLATYDWVEKHLEGNDEVAEIASKHLSEVFQYKEDICWLKEQADKKIPQAQYLLGLLYLGEGSLIDKNESLAIRYLKAAEEGGCKLTEEYLKEIEEERQRLKEEENRRKEEQKRLVEEERKRKKEEEERKKIEQVQAKILAEKRAEESRKLIEKAEKRELEVEELVKIAIDLAYGDNSKGIKKNANKATKLFRMAAEQGCAEAQCQLGIRMIEGIGSRKNWNAGIKWLKKALKGGYEPAKTYLSEYDTLFNRMLHKFIK